VTPWRPLALTLLTLTGSGLAAGCSRPLAGSVAGAPVLSVATGLWPLAQVASLLGGDKVVVVDVVPPDQDPFSFVPDPAETDTLRSAGLVLEVPGLQPGVARAVTVHPVGTEPAGATGAPPTTATTAGPDVTVIAPTAGDQFVWLDPNSAARMVKTVETAMAAADPAAASLFRRNEGGLLAQLSSVGFDFSSTLSACPGTTLVTPDNALSALAADYQLKDLVVPAGAPPSVVHRTEADLPAGSPAAAIAEPWVGNSGVEAVASAAHLQVKTVDTLAGVPTDTAGDGGGPEYFAQLEKLLSTLTSALGCSSTEQ
jgi:zinc transport system substrate-binding protein